MKMLALLLFFGLAIGAHADGPADIETAERAANEWLAFVDSEQYERSWQQGAALLKSQVAQAQFKDAVQKARGQFGKLQIRKRRTADLAHTLPGVPDGEYVVLRFDVMFAHKADAVETVTMVHEADRVWRACGYFLR